MASEVPGWCRQCLAPLVHDDRTSGRAKEFCGSTCRQRFSRRARLRAGLKKEVGLTEAQVDRLLDLYRVSER